MKLNTVLVILISNKLCLTNEQVKKLSKQELHSLMHFRSHAQKEIDYFGISEEKVWLTFRCLDTVTSLMLFHPPRRSLIFDWTIPKVEKTILYLLRGDSSV